MRSLILAALPGASLTAVPAHAEAAQTCQGKPVTIVGSQGTDGDDVMLYTGGIYEELHAGAGDDTVCARVGVLDGGSGVDSVEVVGTNIGEGSVALIDFEHLDVRVYYYFGVVSLEWTEVPSELSGAVDASNRDAERAGKYFDEPTVVVKVAESSTYGLRLNMRSGNVKLGKGLGFGLTGVEDIRMSAQRVRAHGSNDNPNDLGASGCDVVIRGGNSTDRLSGWHGPGQFKGCPPIRLFGRGGYDKLEGGKGGDVLIGGEGRDRAFGGPGKDRCVAEREYECER